MTLPTSNETSVRQAASWGEQHLPLTSTVDGSGERATASYDADVVRAALSVLPADDAETLA